MKTTRLIVGLFLILLAHISVQAQTNISQWNFNSNPVDASTSTGSSTPSIGSGTSSVIGGVAASFASGASNGGSSDPATTDNTGYSLTTFPASGAGNKTAGYQFAVSTAGYQNIQINFDLRHSNTGSRFFTVQYTTNVTASSPVWIDFATDSTTAGDLWNNRTYNFTSVTALNNDSHAAFRIVSAFSPTTGNYVASSNTSSYATTGTWRLDMFTVKGTSAGSDTTKPIAQLMRVNSAIQSSIKFNEKMRDTQISVLTNYSFTPALSVTGASLSSSKDTVFLTHNSLVNGQNYTVKVFGLKDSSGNTMDTATFTILHNSSLPKLVITEVAHSPNDMEFIEVYNADTGAINLNGFRWTDGTAGNFPNLMLAKDSTILFSTVPTTASTKLNGKTFYLLGAGLGSTNDQLVIRNTLNQIVDTVNYFVGTNNWPAAPTGVHAYSFELDSAYKENNDGVNWKVPNNIISSSSGTILATPGIYPPPPVNPAPQITSFRQIANNRTWIRFNQMVTSSSAKTIANYVLAPTLTIDSIQLSTSGDTALIFHAALNDGLPYTLTVNNVKNFSNVSNVSNTMNLIWNQSMPNLVITEIIHSPNDVESIEVYNAGSTIVNLGGLKWTNGTGGNFPVDTLHPGRVRMFSTAPSTAKLNLKIDTAYTLTAGLGSSDDILVIRNSLDQIVDSVNYFVGNNGWPAALSGIYAYSFELNAATNDNNIGTNWNIPLNTITPQPSVGVIRASSGIYPPPVVIVPNGLISFVGTRTTVNETTSEVKIIAQLNGANNQAASAQLEILSLATATNGTDYTPPASMMFQWDSAQNGNDTLIFQITNDNTSEFSEYVIVKMKNLVNAKLADSLSNHHTIFIQDEDKQALTAQKYVELEHITSFSNGASGSNSAEIVAYDKLSKRLFIANSIGNKLDIVNFSNPSSPSLIRSISLSTYGSINSVAAKDGKIALAIENNTNPQANGKVVFMDTAGTFISSVDVGAMPDMITFNHSGTQVLTPNEGEPNTTYSADPNGSISIVDISGGLASVTNTNVTTLDFTGYDSQIATLRSNGVRIFGLGATVAKDMEPEYITVLPGDSIAHIACQENNAIVIVNLISKQITEIRALGTKDFSEGAGALDVSDQGNDIHIAQWPVKGVYMPDAISSFQIAGQNYIITANEGDAREYNAYSEIKRISDVTYKLDSIKFPNSRELKANIGRLNITTASGDTDGDGDFDEIHTFGSRSVSIFNATTGALVWDGGADMEWLIAKHPSLATIFNASNANNTRKNRSDDKGPEPEGVATAKIGNNTYAFVALERIGGCMVYDVTNPAAPVYQDYKNTRNIATYAGDNGAEGIIHIPAAESPDGQDWVILANEVSSTLSIYKLKTCFSTLNKSISAIGNTTFCQGDSVRIKAASQSNVSYQWQRNGTNVSAIDSNIIVKLNGTYKVLLTTLSPVCSDSSNSIAVTVNPIPLSTISAVGNTEFCQGDSVRLKAISQSNVAYRWFKDGVAASNTDSNIVIKAAGNYTARLNTISPACSTISNVVIVSVNPLPTVTFNLPLDSICDTIFNLNLTGASPIGGSFKWNNNVITAFSPKTSGIGNYTFTYEVTDAKGCKNSASDNIKVVVCIITPPPLGIQAAHTSEISLYPNPVQTILYIENGGVITDFELFNQLGMKIIQGKVLDNKIDVSKLENGIYHLSLTDNKGNNYTRKILK
jgi:hypothetical protein